MRDAGGITVAVRRGTEGGVRWRLTAGNHRGLGLSAATFDSEPEARAAALAVARAAQSLTPQIFHPRSSVDWKWTALDPSGRAVAVAERTYGRYGTCVSAYRRFVLAMLAAIDAGDPPSPADLDEDVLVDDAAVAAPVPFAPSS